MPMTAGQHYLSSFSNSGLDFAHVFNDDEVYVLNVQDDEILSSLGNVAMSLEAFSDEDEYRVYEDYYDEDAAGV